VAVDVLLERAEIALREARFERAEELVRAAREAMREDPDAARRVRLETISATAEVAYGRHEAAIARFEQALAVDPDLELDPRENSPKLRAALVAARARRAAPEDSLPAVAAPPLDASPFGVEP